MRRIPRRRTGAVSTLVLGVLAAVVLSPVSCAPWPRDALPGRAVEVPHAHSGGAAPTPRTLGDLNVEAGAVTSAQLNTLLDAAQGAGVQVVASAANWSALQPAEDQIRWDRLDQLVSGASRRNLKIRLQVCGLPAWARDDGSPQGDGTEWYAPQTHTELAAWSGFLAELASRYASRVEYFEVWNEENDSHFWYGGSRPQAYADLLAASYRAIKGADATAKVVFGGLSRNDVGYLSAVYRSMDERFAGDAELTSHFSDLIGVHPYSDNRPPEQSSTTHVRSGEFGTVSTNFSDFRLLHEYLASHHEATKRLYIGEYGFSTAGAWGFPGVSESDRSRYLQEAFRISARSGYVEAFSWYCFYPTPYDEPGFALLTPEFAPLPSYSALRSVLLSN